MGERHTKWWMSRITSTLASAEKETHNPYLRHQRKTRWIFLPVTPVQQAVITVADSCAVDVFVTRYRGNVSNTPPLKRGSPLHSAEQSLTPTESIDHHVVQSFGYNFTPTKSTQWWYLACRKVFRKPLQKGVLPHTLGKTPPPMFKTPLPF